MRHLLLYVTYGLLVTALVLAAVAWDRNPDFDRASIAFTLFAAVTGLVADRLLAEWERRREMLRALVHDLYVCMNIFKSPEMAPDNAPAVARSYPRLPTASVESCLTSGIFTTNKDRDLLKRMYEWRDRAAEFNAKLGSVEHLVFSQASPAAVGSFHKGVTTSNTTRVVRDALVALSTLLMDRYASLSGIARDTELFPDNDA